MTKITAAELWKAGIPIADAWLHFAPPALRRKLRRPNLSKEIEPKSGLGMLVRAWSENANGDASRIEQLEQGAIQFKQGIEMLSHTSRIQGEMQSYLLNQLRCGALLAVGHLSSDSAKAPPMQIPERFLEMRFINWRTGTIKEAQHEFRSVRICARPMHDKLAIRNDSIPAPGKTPGRPPVSPDIIAAMLAIAKDDPTTAFSPQKKWAPIIRKRVHEMYPNKWGIDEPADRTIKRIIPAGRSAIKDPKNTNS